MSFKNVLFFIAGSSVFSHSLAQTPLLPESNMMRSGDQIYRQEVEFFDPGEAGQNIVWDLSGVEILEEKESLTFWCDSDSIRYQTFEPFKILKYEFREDSLLHTGYETSLQQIDYNQPLMLCRYPYTYGDRHVQTFRGNGEYCKRYLLESNGTFESEADATGSIILSTGDTLQHVLRIHTINTSAISQRLAGQTIDTLNLKQRIEEKYIWYALGYRYPVFESTSVTILNNLNPVTCQQKAYSTLFDDQELEDDEINENIRDSLASCGQQEKEPCIRYDVIVEDSAIKIAYTALQDVHIQGILCDRMGLVYQRATDSCEAGENSIIQIPYRGLKYGVYILYINVNGDIFTEKINLHQ